MIAIGRSDTTRNTLPPLNTGEEAVLCRRSHEHHDITAAGRLTGNHLHLVVGVAMAHHGCGVRMQKLIPEGYVGLTRAACRYDPFCGTKFAAYTTWAMYAAIRESILRVLPWTQQHAVDVETLSATPPLHVRGGRYRAQPSSY